MSPEIMAAAMAAASAVSAGLATGVSETAKLAVGDAYQKVKDVLARRYSAVDVEVVESRPQVPARQAVLAEELAAVGASADAELAAAVQVLLGAIEQHSPKAAELVGVQLKRVDAGRVEVRGIRASGASGVIAEDVKAAGEFSVTDVQVVSERPDPR
ncbi:hypothetical protein [Nocardia lijiangensis]|uniref:hypothetical protein n=1 Tax=Nocardia lijiangensis TaxID=299618 RepID=UPI0012DDBD4A|nr:hypothetical protein [Nocardia lijiangensis]